MRTIEYRKLVSVMDSLSDILHSKDKSDDEKILDLYERLVDIYERSLEEEARVSELRKITERGKP